MDKTPLENWISAKTGIDGRPELPKLREYQLFKLRETLRLVKANSRLYEERLAGVSPDSIHTMADVARLPFTYPKDIAERGTDLLCVPPREIGRIVTLSTSGTTGNPKRIYFTAEDQSLTVDFFHHGMMTFTGATDRVMIFMPGSTEGSVGDLLTKGLARFGCESVVYGPVRNYEDALKALQRERITSIVGIPSQMLTLSRYHSDAVSADTIRLKSVLLSADYVPKVTSDFISAVWGAAVYGHYGMTETGLGGGVECRARQGHHLREADLLYEIVDPSSGQPVPDGEWGEVVFSTLTRRGMPLIRYRTGDRSRFLTAPCPCGTVLRRMDRVSGRLGEIVTLADGQDLSITQLDELILADPSVLMFRAELTRRNGCDVLVLTVKTAGPPIDRKALARKLDPLLGGLIREGRLNLEINDGDVDFFTTGTLKRRIADHRNT
jgi:phenylacetate-coenzyme A ligase PaaK-like adenylate-forming protein